MAKPNTQILNHFYGLLLEMNYSCPDEDVFPNHEYKQDAFIMHHLQQVKMKSAKYRALMNKTSYLQILEEIKRLKAIGIEKLKGLINAEEAKQLQPLFRKFDELTAQDEVSITEDQELLQLITALKERIRNQDNDITSD